MYIPFDQLSDEARIWIYQASRSLEREERVAMLQSVQAFLAQWASHGNPLQCSADILHSKFLILAVEESFQGATGCAVDASVQFIRGLEKVFQIDLLDRTQVTFRHNEEDFVIPLAQLKEKVKQGIITADMSTFDNTLTEKSGLMNRWLVPARDSWLAKYFAQV